MSRIRNSKLARSRRYLNEYANYEPNQLLANVIGNYISGMMFSYEGYISDSNYIKDVIPIRLNIELNGDDVDVIASPNVIYCYINASNIDYVIEGIEDNFRLSNTAEVMQNTKFIPVDDKTWKDDTNLYRLKININTGIISRYDQRLNRFTKQEVNWNTATPEEVVRLLLTEDYLEDYFRNELCILKSEELFDIS